MLLLFNTKKNINILLLILLLSLVNFLLNQELITDKIYQQTYSGQLPATIIAKILKIKHQYGWLSFAISPIILFIKLLFVACCLWIGSVFKDTNDNFKKLWKIVIISEFVFVSFSFVNTGLLYYINFQNISKITQFQPFSLYGLLNIEKIPIYFHYTLAVLSIPEITYWIVLAMLLKSLLKDNFKGRIIFIAKTYGVGLLIWITFVTFMIINFTE